MNDNYPVNPISDEEIKEAANSLEGALVDAADKVVSSFKVGERRGGKKIGIMRAEPEKTAYVCDGNFKPDEQGGEAVQEVALTPDEVAALVELGHEVLIQAGAGRGAGYPDDAFTERGAKLVYSDEKILNETDYLLKSGEITSEEAGNLKPGKVIFAKLPLADRREILERLLDSGAAFFALERFRAFDSESSRCEGYDVAWERSDTDERQIEELLIAILNDGVQVACADHEELRSSIIAYEGKLTDEKIGSSQGMDWVEPIEALGINLWTLK